jgi:opacity protein-like surface antigen
MRLALLLVLVLASAQAARAQQAPGQPAPQRQDRTIADIIGSYNTMAGTDSGVGSPADPRTNELRLSAKITQLVGSRLQLYYFDNNGAYNSTLGRVTNAAGQFIYPKPSTQSSIEIGAHYVTGSHTYLQAAYFYRWQVCCPATAAANNLAPTNTERLYYLEAGYHTSPLWHTGIVASYAVHGVLDPQHLVTPAYLATLPHGVTDSQRSITGLYQILGLTTPLDRDARVNAFANFMYGAIDYFNNSYAPYYYDAFVYGLYYHVTQRFTLTSEINQFTQRQLDGFPFVYPNAIHRSILIMNGDYALSL